MIWGQCRITEPQSERKSQNQIKLTKFHAFMKENKQRDLRKMNILPILFFGFFMNACSGVGYYCESKGGYEKPFVFNNKKVTINYSKSFYFTKKNIRQRIRRHSLYKKGNRFQIEVSDPLWTYEYHDPLIAKPGAYNAKKSEEEVVVRYAVEEMLSLSQLPSGKVVDSKFNRAWYERVYLLREYSHWINFTMLGFEVKKYVFNIPQKTLTEFTEYPFPPQRGKKTSYQFKDGQWITKHLGSMSQEELNDSRFYSQHNRSKSYNCEKLKGNLFWIYYTYPLWGWMVHLT